MPGLTNAQAHVGTANDPAPRAHSRRPIHWNWGKQATDQTLINGPPLLAQLESSH